MVLLCSLLRFQGKSRGYMRFGDFGLGSLDGFGVLGL